MKKTKLVNADVLQGLQQKSWPHLEEGQPWKSSADSLKHVCRCAKELHSQGIPLEQIASIFSTLYWCASDDIGNIPKPKPSKAWDVRTIPYFDEFQIMFRMDISEVTPEVLAKDYEFESNLYAKDGEIWWGSAAGSTGGCPLHEFLGKLKLDNDYAFGPTKNRGGWKTEKLAELNAVGVYKRKTTPVHSNVKPKKGKVSRIAGRAER